MKKTALYSNHINLKAKMINYNGWNMPISYTGIITEHLDVRQSAGLFDVSHMGIIDFYGDLAGEFLNEITVNDVFKLNNNKSQYSMICQEDGIIIDDIIISKCSNFYRMIVNASNREKDWQWLELAKEKLNKKISFKWRNDFSIIALQGSKSDQFLEKIGIKSRNIKKFCIEQISWKGINLLFSSTGYTGEKGYEIFVKNTKAGTLWSKLIEAGVTPIGLGARDSLRIEAGLPLYGQEIQPGISPFDLNYDWVVKFNKKSFMAKKALLKSQENRKWVKGLVLDSRVMARPGTVVKEGGHVTSSTFSPTLSSPIAIFISNKEFPANDSVTLLVRGKEFSAKVVDLPFI